MSTFLCAQHATELVYRGTASHVDMDLSLPSPELLPMHLAVVPSVLLSVLLLAGRHDLDDYVAASLSLYLVSNLHVLYLSPIFCNFWVVEPQREPFGLCRKPYIAGKVAARPL